MAFDVRELSFEEIDLVNGASKWGDNVLKYGGAGGAIGAFGGLQGAAIGILAGALVGTIVTIAD
jgi:hypothetical protein